jgi:signal peptidase I
VAARLSTVTVSTIKSLPDITPYAKRLSDAEKTGSYAQLAGFRLPPLFPDIKRRDVIVFKYPEEPDRDFIKRVIGLPGETVEVRDKKVYVNGQALVEPYVHFLQPPAGASEFHEVTSFDVRERYGPVTVPPNHYFVMGDNRDNSQ